MFLNTLSDSEKRNFLELAYIIIASDGEISPKEVELLNSYMHEMRLTENDYKPKGKSFEEILNELSKSDRSAKRKIFLELLALALSDDKYVEAEKVLMERLAQNFEISAEDYDEFFKIIEDLKAIYNRALLAVL